MLFSWLFPPESGGTWDMGHAEFFSTHLLPVYGHPDPLLRSVRLRGLVLLSCLSKSMLQSPKSGVESSKQTIDLSAHCVPVSPMSSSAVAARSQGIIDLRVDREMRLWRHLWLCNLHLVIISKRINFVFESLASSLAFQRSVLHRKKYKSLIPKFIAFSCLMTTAAL